MTLEEYLPNITEHGLYAIETLTLFVCGLGIPLPEEAVFLATGALGSKPTIHANVWILCICGVMGIMLGDSTTYWLGRKYGLRLLKRRPFSWILKEKGIEKTRIFFGRHGSKTVFIGRFFAGVRTPTFFMAGSMGVPYWKFVAWDLAGALISCPTSIWLAYFHGKKVAEEILNGNKPILFTVLAIVVLYLIYQVWAHRERPEGCEAKPLEPDILKKSPSETPGALPVTPDS